MTNKIKFIFYTALLLLGFGCVDLDEQPLDFAGPDNFYNTPAQIQSAFTSSMSRLYRRWNRYGYSAWGIHRQDDQINGGDLVLTAGHGGQLWSGHYQAIADLNPAIKAVLDGKLGTQVTEEEKNQLLAQAYFYRGYNYFYLVRYFGGIPLITEDVDVNNDEISRATVEQSYELIVKDLEFAVANLPESWAETPGRPTSGTAKGMLAKVYLTMASAPLNDGSAWAKARDLAADVMDDGTYMLVENIDEVFALENEQGPEFMFSFQANSEDPSTPPQIWLPSHMARGWGDFRPERDFFDEYPEQPRRHAYLIITDWDGVNFKDWPGGEGLRIRKFIYDTRENLERLTSTQNIPILRFADVLLIFAEAENMVNGGPTQAAVDAVNQVIDRANGGVENPDYPRVSIDMSQADFDAAVIRERSLELCFENDRWFDLIRKRILCDEVDEDFKPNCDDNDYLWPIPADDLRLNALMTQNPGYPTPE